MAMARYNISKYNLEDVQPCIRVSPEIDFFRGQPGQKSMGDFLDDSNLAQLPMKIVKAFTDIGQRESMSWARWGAAKWVQGSHWNIKNNKPFTSPEPARISSAVV